MGTYLLEDFSQFNELPRVRTENGITVLEQRLYGSGDKALFLLLPNNQIHYLATAYYGAITRAYDGKLYLFGANNVNQYGASGNLIQSWPYPQQYLLPTHNQNYSSNLVLLGSSANTYHFDITNQTFFNWNSADSYYANIFQTKSDIYLNHTSKIWVKDGNSVTLLAQNLGNSKIVGQVENPDRIIVANDTQIMLIERATGQQEILLNTTEHLVNAHVLQGKKVY